MGSEIDRGCIFFFESSYGPAPWNLATVRGTLPVLALCMGDDRRRDRSTKSAASSASLRSVLRGVPICARMVRLRAKSVTWIARTATGKSDGISPAVIPSRKRPSTSATRAGGRVLQELPDLSVVHKRRDAHEKTSPRGPFLGRTFDGVPQEGGDRVAKTLWREECLRGRCALPFCIRLKDAQEYRPLVAEDGIQARPSHAHPGDEIVDRHSVVALRPEYLGRLFQRSLSSKLRGRPRGLAVF